MFKPMKAPIDDPLGNPKFFDYVRYPLIASPKLDGIRCNIMNIDNTEGLYSSSLKLLPNRHAQKLLSPFQGLDGELIDGPPTDPDCYNRTQSVVTSRDKPIDDLHFYIFDCNMLKEEAFEDRIAAALDLYSMYDRHFKLKIVPQILINDYEELIAYEDSQLEEGYEGLMLRDPKGPYKYGRATMNEGWLIKLKRFTDNEAVLVNIAEGQHNTNSSFTNETGGTSRSTSKEGMVGSGKAGTLTAIVINGDFKNQKIEIAPGKLKHPEREDMFQHPEKYINRTFTFRHFTHGVKVEPRFPRFWGWRDLEIDG